MSKYTYRKRTTKVEAFQMTKENWQDISGWPEWLSDAWNKPDTEIGALYPDRTDPGASSLVLVGPDGTPSSVPWDHYIVRYHEGHLRVQPPTFFEAQYERVEPSEGKDEDRRQDERRQVIEDRRELGQSDRGRRVKSYGRRRSLGRGRRATEPTDG